MRRGVALGLAGAIVALAATAALVPGLQAWFSSASVLAGERSMGHGDGPMAGALDDGDMGNYQRKPPASAITPALDARPGAGPFVAEDWGDVVVFRPNGAPASTARALMEHRVLAWVDYNETSGLFDVPSLGLRSVDEVILPSVGFWDAANHTYAARDVRVVLAQRGADNTTYPAGQHSGWVTKGDRAAEADQSSPDGTAPPRTELVRPEWVEARLLRVVDAQPLGRDVTLGMVGAVLAGSVGLRLRRRARRAEPAPKARKRWQPSCAECHTPWERLAFCSRCGAERAPKHRFPGKERSERPRRR